jgi:hypothetical protein
VRCTLTYFTFDFATNIMVRCTYSLLVLAKNPIIPKTFIGTQKTLNILKKHLLGRKKHLSGRKKHLLGRKKHLSGRKKHLLGRKKL